MLTNYIKTALKNIRHNKIYSLINIAGLAVGISCFLLLMMLVWDELTYDRFHENADRIYRITMEANVLDRELKTARSSGPMAEVLRTEIPEIEAATRVRSRSGTPTSNTTVRHGDTVFNEYWVFFTDSSYFHVFKPVVLEGNVNSLLTEPNTVVLTDVSARKYFGDERALGKTLKIDGDTEYRVCGVVKEFPPQSHWRFDMLVSTIGRDIPDEDNWINTTWYTYALLKDGASPERAEATFQSIVEQNVGPIAEEIFGITWRDLEARGMYYRFNFQPITEIHLRSDLDEEILPSGKAGTVYALTVIAVLILLIACINYMNLNTARSARRAREVGIRKVLGSHRTQLAYLFLTETILLSGAALILSLGVIELALPLVNSVTFKSLSLSLLFNPWPILAISVFIVLVGLLAGSYPAFVLSSYQPAHVLKGTLQSGMRHSRLRSILVGGQFAAAITLMIGTIVVYNQLQFLRTSDLGFDNEGLIVVDNTWLLGENSQSFKQMLLGLPGVIDGAFTQNLPGTDIDSSPYRRDNEDSYNLLQMRQLFCDYDFLPFLGVRLKEGRYFSRDFTTDITNAVMINESAANLLGYDKAVGRDIVGFFGEGERTLKIIGVTEDVHYEPLHHPIRPMVILVSRGAPTRIVLRIHGDINTIISDLEREWHAFSGGEPFTWYFLDDRLQLYYSADKAFGKLIGAFSLVSMILSCLGLLGLTTYATEQRAKEIGIRKVLGANVGSIVTMLNRDFLKLVIIGFVIAAPTGWYAMNRWLENFAYRITLGADVFLLAGLAAVLIALATVSYHSVRTALMNPVDSLRSE